MIKVVGVVPVIAMVPLPFALPLPINVQQSLRAPTKMDTNKIQKHAPVVSMIVPKIIIAS